MDFDELSRKLNMAVTEAEARSSWISVSYISVFCFDAGTWARDAGKLFRVRMSERDFEQRSETLKQYLMYWLGPDDPDAADIVCRAVLESVGEPAGLCALREDSSVWKVIGGRNGPFYTVEGMFVCLFEDPCAAVMFAIGNNE